METKTDAERLDEIDCFIQHKGNGEFKIKSRFSRKFRIASNETYVLKFTPEGFVAIRSARYFNRDSDFNPLLESLRKLDQHISGRIREDDELLQMILFRGK